MDGQNFQNENEQTNGQVIDSVIEPVVEPAAEPAATENQQENTYQSNTYQDNTAQYSNPTYSADPYYTSTAAQPETPKTPGVSVAALVLGIAGIVFDCCCGVGLIFGIIGLILAIVGNKQEKSGVGTAGLVCSIIAIVFGAFSLLYMFVLGGLSMMESL